MDLAAGIAGLVGLGLQVSQSLISYYDGWRHSRQDVDDICHSVGDMRQMLTLLEETVKRHSLERWNGTEAFERLLKQCKNTMGRLDAKTRKFQDDTATSGFLARARSEWERVKYPLKESTILKLRDLLQQQKLDLALILNDLNIHASYAESETLSEHMSRLSCDITQIGADVEENKNILKTSVQDLKRKEVLGWIYSQDPSMLYQSRESKRHPGTCQWFLQGQEYLRWRSTGSLLWVKGEVLQIVEELYEKFKGSTASRPLQYHDIELALDLAIACLKRCRGIYIVLDALDELPNSPDEYQRSRVLNWIKATSIRYRHVHILFTSRSNSSSGDIEDFASIIPSIGVVTIDAMSNRDDMFSYLEAQFKKSRVLSKFPGHSLSKTLHDIISLSDGM
ncbi:hypothetical protein AbraIFM66951_010785 [Aspergillus brasiliensis]|nr:hypothetical protein AbraIFM66951_010785 [Aspergillus brasiliensis]